jgi:hypothetical protein
MVGVEGVDFGADEAPYSPLYSVVVPQGAGAPVSVTVYAGPVIVDVSVLSW